MQDLLINHIVVRGLALALALLIPAQALAHCGALVSEHVAEHHHAVSTTAHVAQTGNGPGDLLSATPAPCVPQIQVFTSFRSQEPGREQYAAISHPLSETSSSPPAAASVLLKLPSRPPASDPTPVPPPLRI